MYELVQVGPRTYYIECPAKIGVYEFRKGEVCLIDSGNDKDSARKVLKVLETKGWKLSLVINTHSNADHIGGNSHLQDKTGCAIYARGIEAAFTRHPILETSFLYGGFPVAELRNKFLLAKASDCREVTSATLPEGLEIIELGGHFFDMIGLRTADGVVFLADCLFSEAILEKYRIPFMYDVARFLEVLDRVESMRAERFVPAHAPATRDIRPLVAANRENVAGILAAVRRACAAPARFEDILKTLCDAYGLTLDFNQYALIGSTLRSVLAYLHDAGRVDAFFEANSLLWKDKEGLS